VRVVGLLEQGVGTLRDWVAAAELRDEDLHRVGQQGLCVYVLVLHQEDVRHSCAGSKQWRSEQQVTEAASGT
jgi:hypothetical protein